MLDVLSGFFVELRIAGIDLTTSDALAAAEAVSVVPLGRRSYLFSALAATLIKDPDQLPLFRMVFEMYFALPLELDPLLAPDRMDDDHGQVLARTDAGLLSTQADAPTQAGELWTAAELQLLLHEALLSGDQSQLAQVAVVAVEMYARVPEASHLNVAYFLDRTLRGLNLAAAVSLLENRLVGEGTNGATSLDGDRRVGERFERRMARGEVGVNAGILRSLIADQIRLALARTYGVRAVVEGMHGSLLDQLDVVHASDEEMAALRRAVLPLARHFAARMRRSRSLHSSGRLDFRRTIRKSLSSGGWLGDPQFRRRKPSKPELFLLADVSGSVAAFASFIFSFMFALSRNIPNVRIAVFVNRVDEVTEILTGASSLPEAIQGLALAAANLHQGGDSDYGSAFEEFERDLVGELGPKTRLIVIGDGRTNHTDPRAELLQDIRRRVGHVYWLNPEPRQYWGTGDSAMDAYSDYCDAVFECRTLQQLKAFVAEAR
jgi:uncharacterized protein